jgi:hypothetical protein
VIERIEAQIAMIDANAAAAKPKQYLSELI